MWKRCSRATVVASRATVVASRATVVAMDRCLLSVNNTYFSEQRKERAKFVDYRYLFMRPGVAYFDPYIASGNLHNIVNEQWMWTVLKTEVVEKVADYVLAAYRNYVKAQ